VERHTGFGVVCEEENSVCVRAEKQKSLSLSLPVAMPSRGDWQRVLNGVSLVLQEAARNEVRVGDAQRGKASSIAFAGRSTRAQ
jgi:hypothetical protein